MNLRTFITFLFFCLALFFIPSSHGQVSFSSPGGFYSHAFTLQLSAPPEQHIHYTTDGSTPTLDAPLYQQPLTLSPALYSSRSLFLMPNAPEHHWNPPAEVRRAILLRAQAFDSQNLPVGPVITHTYFISDLLQHQSQLPAVSIAIDYQQLYDPDSGIFSPTGWSPNDEFASGNFNQHGHQWERLAHVEYYDSDNHGFAQDLGIRVHGGKSRQLMQKPLKLYARKEYGNKKINYPIFQNHPYDSFKRLVLRPFCSALTSAGVQDFLAHKIAQPLHFLSLASRPVTLYLNGEYWGIYYLQEAPDERLIEQVYDVESDSVNIIGPWFLVENGNDIRFKQMMQWLRTADLADTLQYQYFATLFDIDNFIDYQLFESFIANQDWPANNIRCYQYGEAPWRWIFYDGDDCFVDIERDMPYYVTYAGNDTWPSSADATLFFRKLIESPIFIQQYGSRLQELYNTTFQYSNTSPLLEEIKEELSPEIEWQRQRFGIPSSEDHWRYSTYNVDNFLRQRPDIFRYQFEELLFMPEMPQPYSLFPNPARDQVTILNSSGNSGWVHCSVYDLMGRAVHTTMLFFPPEVPKIQFSLSSLPPGLYLLRFSNSPIPYRLIIN